jgi:PAS domain S-box-containing protein
MRIQMKRKRILIVEDNPVSAKTAQLGLIQLGYDADQIVASGEEAIRMAEQTAPDLILMDIELNSEMDGIEAGRQIRSRFNIPIIYLSSHTDESLVDRAKFTEPFGYLVKPFRAEELRTNIEMALYKHQIERRLAESEDRYRSLFGGVHDGIATFSLAKNGKGFVLSSLNKYFSKLFKPITESAVGKNPKSLMKKFDGFNLLDALQKVWQNGGPESFSIKDTKNDALSKWVECHVYKLTDEELVLVAHDITHLKKAEEDTLYRSEERFRSVFDSVTDCIVIKDSSLRYTHVNSAAINLLGIPKSKIIGLKSEDVFGAEIGKKIEQTDGRALTGESVQYEQTRVISDIPLTFSETVTPIRNWDDEVIGICCVGRNITEQKSVMGKHTQGFKQYPSRTTKETLRMIQAAAKGDGIICLLGESGCGKDYVARWIHNHSPRSSGPFFPVNCAALPENLAESELFGHDRGAFTGAAVQKRGLLELAEGGTILLNEIGELPIAVQVKLLTFLDTKTFVRLGGLKQIGVDSRLIVATHRDLDKEVADGRFLAPLFHRINVFPLHIPPLRDRSGDIPTIVGELLSKLCLDMQIDETPILDETQLGLLSSYHWPGNIRELRNVLERSLMLWTGGKLTVQLPSLKIEENQWTYAVNEIEGKSFRELTTEIGASLCREVVRRCSGNKTEASKRLGISRDALYRHMK